jgi:hypothetical protein
MGVASLICFVILVGWLGIDSPAGRLFSVVWLLAALILALVTRRPFSIGESAE